MAFLFDPILCIFIACFLNDCQGVFLASKLGDASATGLPALDDATLKVFHDNGIHGEVVGFAAKEERECGIVLLDYSSYTDGRMFDGVLEAFEKTLNISGTLNEKMRMKVYTEMKEDAKRLHLQEMEAAFKKYRAVTPYYSTGQLEFFPGFGVVAFGIGIGLGELAYHEIKSLIYKYSDEEHQQKRLVKQVLEMQKQLHDLAEILELKTSMIRFEFVFAQIRTQLLTAVEDALTGLFDHGRVTDRLISHHGEGNLLSAIANLMGSKRFNASVLKSRYDVAGKTLRATVLSMNRRVMEVKICYPVTMEESVGYLTRMVQLGGFSEDMTTYSSYIIGAHYIVPSSMVVSNLSALEEVSNIDECSTLSSILLCKTKPQSTCGLHTSNQRSCTVLTHNSSDEEFTLIEPLLKTVVVITRMKRMYYKKAGADAFESLEIKSPVIVVEVPRGAELHIGSMKVVSRVTTGNMTMDLTIALPSNRVPIGPTQHDQGNSDHYIPNEDFANWGNSSLSISFLFIVFIVVIFAILYYHRQLHRLNKRWEQKLLVLTQQLAKMASRIRSSSKYHKVLEIGNEAKANLNRMRSENIIRYLPENLPEDIFYPKHSNEGANFCVICGKQGEYRLSTHLDRAHSELVAKDSMDYKIIMQLGHGIIQYMGRAKIHLSDVRKPITAGEWNIYHDFVQQLKKCGIPTDGGHEDTRIDRYKYVRRDEVEMMVNEAVNARLRGINVGAQAEVGKGTSFLAQPQVQQAEEGSQLHSEDIPLIEPIDAASFSLIKQKVKRGESSVAMAPPQLKADVVREQVSGTSEVRKDSTSTEEELEEYVAAPSGVPPTFKAPRVARNLLYESFGDVLYSGDPEVADIFKRKPKLKYMFSHEFDSYDPNYFTQEYKVSKKNSEALKWDKNLKFWRKVVRKSHPLLQQFEQYILEKLPETTEYKRKITGGVYSYVQIIDRFMLVAMRSRQRMGQTVTVDDAIYAGEIILPYMKRLKEEGVSLSLRQLITRSLSSFERFMSVGLEKRAGRERQEDLEKIFRRRVYHQWTLINTEEKQKTSLRGIVQQEKREALMYCITRAVVDHKEVDKAIENLMDKFEHDGMLNPVQYNYLMGAIFSYVVHCNTSRNEVIYKMMYGSIKAPEAETKAASGIAQNTDITGLKSIEVEWEGREKEELWVGSYPYPKVRASFHKTAYGGQFFVLDKKSKKWIDYYLRLRDFVIQMNHLEDMMKPNSPFFLQYKGNPVERYNVSHLMKQFLRDSGFTELNLSCNATRHAIATGQYEDFYRKKCEQLGIADEDMAALASHSKRVQLARYQDAYMTSCAYGYVKVRQIAQRQEAENQDAVQRVRDMFKLANLESRRRTAVPDMVANELELEDFDDDLSLPSDSEGDHSTIVLEEQPGPSSRTGPTRQRSAPPPSVIESPKKRPRKSNVKKESGEKKSKTQSKLSKKVPRIVIGSSDESEL